jgi:hypothetical protein
MTKRIPYPSPLPAGEREGVRGNFKCVRVEFIWDLRIGIFRSAIPKNDLLSIYPLVVVI